MANILRPKAKCATFLGSYGWGGNLFGKLGELLSGLKLDVIDPFLVKGKPKDADFKTLDDIAEKIYEKHKVLNLL